MKNCQKICVAIRRASVLLCAPFNLTIPVAGLKGNSCALLRTPLITTNRQKDYVNLLNPFITLFVHCCFTRAIRSECNIEVFPGLGKLFYQHFQKLFPNTTKHKYVIYYYMKFMV
jgi:hypothetical protein